MLGITLALAAVCAVLIFHVNINTDMTKYLPSDSNMRAGLEIMTDEFGNMSEMAGSDVRVLCEGLSDEEKVDMMVDLRNLKHVNSVMEQENGSHTLYELGVSDAVDQVAMGKEISEQFPKIKVVETSQDGAAAEAPMLLGGVALLFVILFALCQSWLEPVLFLASTGIAVLINVGTNAFLPSVSVTTNSIVGILQLVLSMDYSIILINRFRQERFKAETSLIAMQDAIKLAAPSIISSAFTTFVGLIMLVFMNLKIGADLGIVLSKGVICSLICNFTVLPALILIFEKGIDKSQKRVLEVPTDKLAHFSMRFRTPLLFAFILIFFGSFFMRSQTNIIFLNAKASKIEKYFPKKNPVVLVYDNKDEDKIVNLMDDILTDSGVEMVLSYPSLLKREYTAPQMVEAITELSGIMAGMNAEDMPSVSMDMLSGDVLKVVYYAAHKKGQEFTMGFNEMADFILEQAHNPNSLIAKQMDNNLKSKLQMLDDLRHPIVPQETKVEQKAIEVTVKETPTPEIPLEFSPSTKPADIPVRAELVPAVTTKSNSPYADTTMILKPMSFSEMASFLTMDSGQAKAVYKLAKQTDATMTPVEFVHFVTEDILQRRVLAMMIKDSQREQLMAVQNTMDSTLLEAAKHHASNSNSLISTVTTSNPITSKPADNIPIAVDTVIRLKPVAQRNVKDSDPLAILDEMLSSGKKYTAKQMSQNLSALGENVPEDLIDLLYLYYGGNQHYDETWTMSLENMVDFLVESVLHDPRFESFIDDDMRNSLGKVQQALKDGVGKLRSKEHSIAMIITNYSTESPETYAFVDHYNDLCKKSLGHPFYSLGESIMLSEMKAGFNNEIILVTLLTISAIFLIVALSFRSILLAAILVMTVMSGVFVNVMVCGFGGGSLLYIAYLIVQSILMGAAIDYGILFANYYREKRVLLSVEDALKESFRCSIHTIMTSGLILILVPGIMAVLVKDPTICDILKSISIGAAATVLLILFVMPGVLAVCDRIIVRKKKQ